MSSKAKKILAVALFVMILAAGAAYAGGGWCGGGRGYGYDGYGGHGYGHRGGWGGMGGYCYGGAYGGPRGGRGYENYSGRGYGYGADVPQEIRDKMSEAQKISVDIRNELGKNPVDRAKVLELNKKHGDIMREISDWRFQQMLEAN